MASFDQEMKLFEEIKNKYKPIEGYYLVLDLDAYKRGEEIITKFEFDSYEYHQAVNIEAHEKNKEIVIITSNRCNSIHYNSHSLFVMFNFDKNLMLEFFDKTPNPYRLNRTLRQEMELLAYELNHPKPKKPAC